ncbi:ABC transporter permease [Streptomyces acidiscabies]|uniref:ABC transporter permease n=1 Tax=Streptomyces acidiscabies TaxID=42234 RepID=A0AAP6EL21_9ACTN|nr:ABC transporter permease [Streptomyces acidiscabies]MBP5942537.1 ABC transporter permease [Streptomyces sp. LBUM 1476]MBZ3917708.1 ABC transporter permease [Streptomyces acidiscabies]MDX2966649.1 ABC transporter permease [Streptomyces acidiscabies]MDX3025167.1 ABC transporter permease [Streptomyces acidiscabies]MDX3796619.1 ABC transporter permease [Streptomyces acidiscabies]
MLVSVLRKLIRAVAVLLLVSFATFTLMYGNGPGIARAVLGTQATDATVRAEVVELGLDRPLLVQYGDWLKGVVTGDFGDSFFTGQSVSSALSSRVPVTLTLIVLTMLLTVVASVLIGVAAAVRGGWIDRVVQFLSVVGAAVPPFIVAIGLVFAFAVSVRAFPATGYVSPDQSPTGWIGSVTLPVLALLAGAIANSAAQFRGAILDTLSQDFVRTLRARGIPESKVVFRHVLRNAAGPGLTVLSLQTLGLIGGAVFIEQVFALPGLGELSNGSAQRGDVPMVMGCVLVTIVIVLVVNLLGDLVTAAVNPKARTR